MKKKRETRQQPNAAPGDDFLNPADEILDESGHQLSQVPPESDDYDATEINEQGWIGRSLVDQQDKDQENQDDIDEKRSHPDAGP